MTFFVPGRPQPGGSKRGFLHRHTGRIIITDDCKRNKDWRAAVAYAAAEHCKALLTGPLSVRFEFFFQRPKGHFGSGRNHGQVKASAPKHPAVKPDVTKLIRSTEDALTGIAWRDDAQVVQQRAAKHYGEQAGALIEIQEIEE